MKLESDTLYRQWRNLILLCPERCDPNWVDFEVAPMMPCPVKEEILISQAKKTAYATIGYDWFLKDMGGLLNPEKSHITPKVGAGFLSLKYQAMPGSTYDYFIVPKLSRVMAGYACPDENFAVIKRSGRFTLTGFSKTKASFNLYELGHEIRNEGEEYYKLQEDFETEVPLPTEKPTQRRRNAAEAEWIDINLLASYRFNKESIQLLYGPVTGYATACCLRDPFVQSGMRSRKPPNKKFFNKPNLASRLKGARGEEAVKKVSAQILVTATSLWSGQFEEDYKKLSVLQEGGLSPEEYTDTVTGRTLISDETLTKAREQEEDDNKDFLAQNPNETFIFSGEYKRVMRSSDPRDPGREKDFNRGWLFLDTSYINIAKEWYVAVYDIASEAFIPKTLAEWRIDCIIDDISLLPDKYMPSLLNRGLTSDQILLLSLQISEATPEAQVKEIVEQFISEEVKVRLR